MSIWKKLCLRKGGRKTLLKRTATFLLSGVLILLFCSAPTIRKKLSVFGGRFGATEYQGILTLYAVDTFEGGVGSRTDFLWKAAASFEKKNRGILISVENHSVQSFRNRLEQGVVPDMVSYGVGLSEVILHAVELSEKGGGGSYAGKSYALPWCMGAYCLISHGELPDHPRTLIVSQGEYNQPLLALHASAYRADGYQIYEPLAAYTAFLSHNDRVLLGTQRDVHRLERRGVSVRVKPLGEFSDLVQYLSVTTTDGVKGGYAKKFLQHLRSQGVQQKLADIGMISVTKTEVYADGGAMQSLQKAAFGIERTISPFLSVTHLKEVANLCLTALQNGGGSDEIVREYAVGYEK